MVLRALDNALGYNAQQRFKMRNEVSRLVESYFNLFHERSKYNSTVDQVSKSASDQLIKEILV